MRLKIFMTATMMAAFIFGASSSDAQAQTKKTKELEEELTRLKDSLKTLNKQLEVLEEENLRFRIDLSLAEDSSDDTTDKTDTCQTILAPEDYTVEVTDSLLDLWYTHQMAQEAADEHYDMDAVKFASNVPDEVYIERIKKMNSFIQVPYNEIVRNYIIMYSEKMPNSMPHILGLCKYYMPIFEDILDRYGLPVELKAMAIIESAMNPRAESKVGAKGMWQFMYQMAKAYGLHIDSFVDERMDPIKSCVAAAQYLSDSYKMFGDWNLAIASYNCGAGNVRKAISRAGGSRKFWDIWPYLPRETRSYVPAFVGALYTLEYYKEHGLKPEATMTTPMGVDTLIINKQLHLKQVSEFTGAPLEELKNLNPQYRHEIIPGHEREYVLRLPYQYTNSFLEHEDTIYKHKSEVYFDPVTIKKIVDGGDGVRIIYKVKSGDVLGKIASRHNVSVAKIKKWNNLKSDNIRVGQKLVIYRGGSGPSVSQSSTKTTSSSKSSSSTTASSKSSSSSTPSGHIVYTVKQGDTFYSIAKNYPGVSAQNIMDYNGTASSNLRPGMKIKIPKY